MAGLTDTAENLALDYLNGRTSGITQPTAPLQLALTTTAPTDSAAGTEVTGGSYARQDANIGNAASGAQTNASDITFSGMPAVTVAGFELWDSAGTPVRIWWQALDAGDQKTTNAGDDFLIAAGDLDLSID